MTTRLPLRTRGLAALPALSMLLLGAPIPARAQAPDGSTPPPTAGTAMRGSTASPTGGGELIGDENAGGSASNGPLPHNTCRKAPRGTRFTVTLPKETELEDLINWMMSITCQKFIWDRKVRSGKVTIMSPEPVTVDEAYAAFYAALETMGLTVEPSGKYFKIVETTDAKNRTLPLYGDDANAPNSDRFVTQLIRIKNGATKDISDVLNQLKSKQGSVDVIGNLIILTDKGSSIRRLEQACGADDIEFTFDIGAESILITDLAEYFLQNFDALDADFDDGLTESEVAPSRIGITTARFNVLDFNGNASLSVEELEAAVVLADVASALFENFAALNTDNSTGLSFTEAKAGRNDLSSLRYGLLDLNGNGVLTRQELSAEVDLPGFLLDNFPTLDTDDSSALTRAGTRPHASASHQD